jgi:hypothetical protein
VTAGDQSTIRAGNGPDIVTAGSGSTITLGNGGDPVTAGPDSTITVGTGQDTIYAGANDTIILGHNHTKNDTVAFGLSPNPVTIGNGTSSGGSLSAAGGVPGHREGQHGQDHYQSPSTDGGRAPDRYRLCGQVRGGRPRDRGRGGHQRRRRGNRPDLPGHPATRLGAGEQRPVGGERQRLALGLAGERDLHRRAAQRVRDTTLRRDREQPSVGRCVPTTRPSALTAPGDGPRTEAGSPPSVVDLGSARSPTCTASGRPVERALRLVDPGHADSGDHRRDAVRVDEQAPRRAGRRGR